MAGDRYRPHHEAPDRRERRVRRDDGPPLPPKDVQNSMYQFGSNRPPRRGFHFKPKASERDLLTKLPLSEIPVLSSTQTGNRFRDIDNVTDSEEEEMNDSDSDDTRPIKRRKLALDESPTQDTPRWSNPDPYTALPPPDSTSKRIDFVKLIRKARIDSQPQETSAVQDDFISFDDLGIESSKDYQPPANAPTGPKAERNTGPPNPQLPPKPPTANPFGAAPVRAPEKVSASATVVTSLGKRKREDKDDRLIGFGDRSFHANCKVLAKWEPNMNIWSTPWLLPHSSIDSPIVALHKEIIDFYSWIRPQHYEDVVRQGVVKRIEREMKRFRPGCRVEAFGSYAAGLYLPTGDMDLVLFVPDSPIDTMPLSRRQMWTISNFLERTGIVRAGTMLVIAKAKVPIIKFVDDQTGLKIDMSFNNTTGTKAIETFKEWQQQYPALPILVAVIKQFLMIRGLNDNSIGGLGGFAVICLVTSLIQHLPTAKAQNLGEMLVEFFNLYGNLFDLENISIRMDPPTYLDKGRYLPLSDERTDRLVIIDPNRPDNNITGGSNQVSRIFDLFSTVCEDLRDRLDDFDAHGKHSPSFSFLESLVGGDFTEYYQQREALYRVYSSSYPRDAANVPAPAAPVPPPPATSSAPGPTPQSPSGPTVKNNKATEKAAKVTSSKPSTDKDTDSNDGAVAVHPSVRRLERVRNAFPELKSKLAKLNRLTTKQAASIGGWQTWADGAHALDVREGIVKCHIKGHRH